MNLLQGLVIYANNDMSVYLVQGMGLKDLVNYFPMFSNQMDISKIDYINSVLNYYLFKNFSPIWVINFLSVIYLIVNVFVSYLLFKKLYKSNIWSIIFSILYSFSIYYIFRVVSFTPNLYQVFFFPVIFLLLYAKKLDFTKLVVTLFIFFSFSSYYAYFSSLIILFWFLSELVIGKRNTKEKLLIFCRKSLLVFVPLLLLVSLIYSSSLLKNIPFITSHIDIEKTESIIRYRTIEDYYSFSFRPWYFFIPPQSSVFFGEFSKSIYKGLENTGYYLADDYSEREMGGSYMGWHFILGGIFVFIILILGKQNQNYSRIFANVFKNKKLITQSFFIVLCVLLISQPPSFTISGFTIYTPSYILYYIFPAFRALVRLSVVIYLFILIINYFLVLDLYQLVKTKVQRSVFVIVFCLISFVLLAISVPVVNINYPPTEISYLKKTLSQSDTYAVYPNGDYYSIFWIIYHKHKLINPVDFTNAKSGFNSNKFSDSLNTIDGVNNLKDLNVNYLIFYTNKVKNEQVQSIEDFVSKELGDKVFENDNSIIYKVKR